MEQLIVSGHRGFSAARCCQKEAHLDGGESDDRVQGSVLYGKGCVLDLAAEQSDGIGHEEIRSVETFLS